MNITVVGSGGWGTALALVLLENGHQVSMWCRRAEKCQEMQESRENPVLPGVKLPQALTLTCDLNVLPQSQVVVLATPSFAVRATSRQIAPYLKAGTVLVSVAKGIEKDSCLLLHQVIEEEIPNCPVVVLSGPSHAEEVARAIVRAVERGQGLAIVDFRYRLLTAVWRLLPRWLWLRMPVGIDISNQFKR